MLNFLSCNIYAIAVFFKIKKCNFHFTRKLTQFKEMEFHMQIAVLIIYAFICFQIQYCVIPKKNFVGSHPSSGEWKPPDVLAKALKSDPEVCEFEFQSYSHIYFRSNAPKDKDESYSVTAILQE